MMPGPVSPQMTMFVSLQGGYGADSEMGSAEHDNGYNGPPYLDNTRHMLTAIRSDQIE